MNNRELEAKLEESKKLAEKGDSNAAYVAAVLSLTGKNYEGVFHCAGLAYKLSGGEGVDAHEALNLLGDLYEYGRGCERDLKKAAELYGKAAELGNDESQFRLGAMYLAGCGVEKDIDKAVELLEKSATAGNDKGKEYLDYAKLVKDGLIDAVNLAHYIEPEQAEPYMVLTLSGQKIEFKNDKEYFKRLDQDAERAKNDSTYENIYKVKETAIAGMNFYFEKHDIYNNESIYNSVKFFEIPAALTDFNFILMDWTIENSYGLLRCAALEKEGLDNIKACVSLMERLYKTGADESVKQYLINQYRQAADLFKRFNENERAEEYERLANGESTASEPLAG